MLSTHMQTLQSRFTIMQGKRIGLGNVSALLAHIYRTKKALIAEYATDGTHLSGVQTYLDLEQRVAHLASALDALGVQANTRIVVSTDNRFELLLYIFACSRVGAIPVPVNPKLKPQEYAHVCEVSEAQAALVDGHVAEKFMSFESLGHSLHWIWTGHHPTSFTTSQFTENVQDWLEHNLTASLPPRAPDNEEQTAILLCTSGTTGRPKAAALTHKGLLNTAGLVSLVPLGSPWLGRQDKDGLLAALPLTHVMGLSAYLTALCAGLPVLHHQRFKAIRILKSIQEHPVNAFIGVPTMYADLEQQEISAFPLRKIQLWFSGADAMPPDRARRFQEYGGAIRIGSHAWGKAVFVDIYGMVELSGPMAVRVYPPTLRKKAQYPAISIRLPSFEIRTVDENGVPQRWGQSGQLQVRGAGVLKRYEGNPDASPNEEGWFSTGDLATTWPGGFFTLTGRQKDRLKVGGFSVFPAEVEANLRTYPKNAEIVVVGIPDDRMGECPVALIQMNQENEVKDWNEEDFIQWAGEHVAGYRRPRKAALVDAIPRGNHGKIDRIKATQMAESIWAQGT